MKKLSLVLLTSAGALLSACNGGGSSSSNSGGTPSPTPTPTPSPTPIPTTESYNYTFSNGTILNSIQNIVLASTATDIPLTFTVNNLQSGTTLNFSVAQASGQQSSATLASNSTPTLSANSCTFESSSYPAESSCTVMINSNSAAGSYQMNITDNTQNATPIVITTEVPTPYTIQAGKYILTGQWSGFRGQGAGNCPSEVPVGTWQILRDYETCTGDSEGEYNCYATTIKYPYTFPVALPATRTYTQDGRLYSDTYYSTNANSYVMIYSYGYDALNNFAPCQNPGVLIHTKQ